jgi:hypothetical protein
MDRPLPDDVAEIARSLGLRMDWDRQYLVGSSVQLRTRGATGAEAGSGYRAGVDRREQPVDVLREWSRARASPDGPYDALVVTEATGVLANLIYLDTVTHLRELHDRFIAANPQGRTHFYQPWSRLGAKNDLPGWISFERSASRVWQCAVHRVNLDLQRSGRSDRIVALPANEVLAGLIEQALRPQGIPGVSGPDTRATVDRLIGDDIHATRLGAYAMALVTFAYLYQRSPEGAWSPPVVDPATAAALQRVVWRQVTELRSRPVDLSLPACREFVTSSFCRTYWSREEPSGATARLKRLKHRWTCQSRFAEKNERNPLYAPNEAEPR